MWGKNSYENHSSVYFRKEMSTCNVISLPIIRKTRAKPVAKATTCLPFKYKDMYRIVKN